MNLECRAVDHCINFDRACNGTGVDSSLYQYRVYTFKPLIYTADTFRGSWMNWPFYSPFTLPSLHLTQANQVCWYPEQHNWTTKPAFPPTKHARQTDEVWPWIPLSCVGDILKVGSRTECALLILSESLGASYAQLRSDWEPRMLRVIPFSSERKMMSTLVTHSQQRCPILVIILGHTFVTLLPE